MIGRKHKPWHPQFAHYSTTLVYNYLLERQDVLERDMRRGFEDAGLRLEEVESLKLWMVSNLSNRMKVAGSA